MTEILPHPYQPSEPGDPDTTWCRICNTGRREVPGMHTDVKKEAAK